jgi:hypothetical protein
MRDTGGGAGGWVIVAESFTGMVRLAATEWLAFDTKAVTTALVRFP